MMYTLAGSIGSVAADERNGSPVPRSALMKVRAEANRCRRCGDGSERRHRGRTPDRCDRRSRQHRSRMPSLRVRPSPGRRRTRSRSPDRTGSHEPPTEPATATVPGRTRRNMPRISATSIILSNPPIAARIRSDRCARTRDVWRSRGHGGLTNRRRVPTRGLACPDGVYRVARRASALDCSVGVSPSAAHHHA